MAVHRGELPRPPHQRYDGETPKRVGVKHIAGVGVRAWLAGRRGNQGGIAGNGGEARAQAFGHFVHRRLAGRVGKFGEAAHPRRWSE